MIFLSKNNPRIVASTSTNVKKLFATMASITQIL
jgi:hypothetical protein